MTEDPATWSPMQRRLWALNLVMMSPRTLGPNVEAAVISLEQLLAAADPTPGLTIHQDAFGSAP